MIYPILITLEILNIEYLKFKISIIFLIKSTHNKRALRFQTLQFKPITFNYKFMFFKKFRNLKKNFYQHKLTKKKILYPYFNYNFNFFNSFFYCISIFKSFKKYLGIYKNYLGIYKILPLIDCIKIGDKINFYKNIIKFMYFMYIGSVMQLKYYDIFFLISNLGINIPKLATSYGTYITILKKKNKFYLIKLPSKQLIWVSFKNYAILGRNSGIFKFKEYLGKASTNYDNTTIVVRSVAKNPIDHPNGGRTRGKMLFKTPWGLVAKSSK